MKVWTSRYVATAALGVIALGGLAACSDDEPAGSTTNGVADMDPAKALEAAHAATRELDDVTYRGSTTVTGPSGALRGTGELVVTADDRCQSTFQHKGKGKLITRTVGTRIFVYADVAMMRGPLAYDNDKVASLKGKWQATPRPSSRACDLAELLPGPGKFSTFEDAGTGDVDGTPVRLFTGQDDDASVMTVAIATEGEPLVLTVETSRGGQSRFTLVEHDSGVAIEEPPEAKVVNAS